MTKEIQTKCKKCGSDTFWLDEKLGWKCWVDEETGSLECKNKENSIDSLICYECSEPFEFDLEGDQINFN